MSKNKFKFEPPYTPPISGGASGPQTEPPPPDPASDPSRGLGDTVSKIIKRATFGKSKECEPCKKRKEKLNRMFPYDRDSK